MQWLADATGPLNARFGSELTIRRQGNAVAWVCGGQSAIVELLDGRLDVVFLGCETVDEVSGRPAAAAFRTEIAYLLTPVGASRMIRDMADFFMGVREPTFRFVDAYLR